MTCEEEFRRTAVGSPNPERYTVLMRAEWAELGEYSCSLPSGTRVGKRWKRNRTAYAPIRWVSGKPTRPPADWCVGEYYDVGSTTEIGIRWTEPIII